MNTIGPPINIIVADDHQVILDAFRFSLKKKTGYNLVGEASDGEQLIKLAKRLKPDIIITDILMPVIDGITATKELTKELPGTSIIAFSMVDEGCMIAEMVEAGAKGYLLKSSYMTEVVSAITHVSKGKSYYSTEIAAKLAQQLIDDKNNRAKPVFSQTERSIMTFICNGYTNKEIADKLFLCKRTIEWHRINIIEKLDVKNTAGLIIYAIRNNIY